MTSLGFGPSVHMGGTSIAKSHIGGTSDTTNKNAGQTYTFSSHAIGVPSADRIVVVCVMLQGGAAVTVSGLTRGGNAATVHQTNGSDGGVAIASLKVPTGTTADIVVTVATSNPNNCRIEVYTITGQMADAPTFSAIDIATAFSINVTCGVGAVIIAALHDDNAGSSTAWSANILEDTDAEIEANATYSTASIVTTSALAAEAITATVTGGSNSSMALAVWQ